MQNSEQSIFCIFCIYMHCPVCWCPWTKYRRFAWRPWMQTKWNALSLSRAARAQLCGASGVAPSLVASQRWDSAYTATDWLGCVQVTVGVPSQPAPGSAPGTLSHSALQSAGCGGCAAAACTATGNARHAIVIACTSKVRVCPGPGPACCYNYILSLFQFSF